MAARPGAMRPFLSRCVGSTGDKTVHISIFGGFVGISIRIFCAGNSGNLVQG